MSAALRIVSGESQVQAQDVRDELASVLKANNVKLTNAVLSTFQTYDLVGRTILFVGAKSDQPFCIVPRSLEGRLLGNRKLRELPMTISCFKTGGKSIRPIINCGAFDAIGITYGLDEFALVIGAAFLLERLK